MEQMEFKLESDEEKVKKELIKIRLLKLFRSGNEASWLKFLRTDKAQEILNE